MTSATIRAWLHAGTALLLLILSENGRSWWLTGIAAVALAFDGVRLRVPAVRRLVERLLPVYRPAEAHRVSGGAWLMVGYALAGWMPGRAAVGGILAGAVLDPVAALVGRRLGQGQHKSWAGSAAGMVTAAAALMLVGGSAPEAVFGALVGAAAERWPGPFDDNLVVAPAVGLALWAAGAA